MIWTIILFTLGFILLYKGGDIFVDSAVTLARHFGMSEILIGATIVSVGTTLPEMMVSTMASVSGTSQLAYGNAIGSVICNTALIAGILLFLRPVMIKKKDISLGMFFFFSVFMLFGVAAYITGNIDRKIGAGLIVVLIVYMLANIYAGKKETISDRLPGCQKEESVVPVIMVMAISAAFIFVGSNLLVNNGIVIARMLHIPERIIGLTFIALGTSLPELVTALTAISKGHGGVSLGNIIGANFLNIAGVIGTSAVILPISISKDQLLSDGVVAVVVMLILTVPAFLRGRTRRRYGIILICIYVFYCIYLFGGSIQENTVDVFAPYIINH